VILALIQLVLVVLWSTTASLPARSAGIAASVLTFVASIGMCLLSPLEHGRSLRPSALLGVYLLFTTLFDAAILRTVWLTAVSNTFRAVLTTSFSLKAIVVILEAQGKHRHVVNPQDLHRSPEDFSGPYSRSVMWWLNNLLSSGFKQILTPADLFPNDHSLRAEQLSARFWTSWNNGQPLHVLLGDVPDTQQ
jgi:hypothetical protein